MRLKPQHLLPTALLALLATVIPASAEIVFLTSGRTLSVKSHRVDGDRIVLTLRSGGEVTCDKSIVEKVEPDEVPYIDPDAPKPAAIRMEQRARLLDIEAEIDRTSPAAEKAQDAHGEAAAI